MKRALLGILRIIAFLLFRQLFPLLKKFLLMEPGIVQFITFFLQKQVVPQNFRIVDLIFQLDNVGAQFLNLVFHRFQPGAHLRTAAALLLAISRPGCLFPGGGGRLCRLSGRPVMKSLKIGIEVRPAPSRYKMGQSSVCIRYRSWVTRSSVPV